MKSGSKITSIMLLIALVLSMVPVLALPSQVSASPCYRAQFITDVTVPDGTTYESNTFTTPVFKKTWRLKNIGFCAWNGVTMVFDSGAQMGAPASVPVQSGIVPGQTVDVSVDMVVPDSAGHYIGYWKFKSEQGTIFGIGATASKAWWAEIYVEGSAATEVAYDFSADADKAVWSSGAGGLTFPGTDGDTKGFVIRKDNPTFEGGFQLQKPGLLFAPQNITNGYIQGVYPSFKVHAGDKFQATIGCENGATSCYVAYRLDYQTGSGSTKTFWSFREKYEGLTYNLNLDLASLAGQDVKFTLFVSAYGSPSGDRALWGSPVIVRPGIVVTPGPTTPPPPITVTVPPSTCDKVQYVADVTIPDGTIMQPGAQFTKTWRLKNVGTCTWKKDTYQLVYISGSTMGSTPAVFPQDVPVGQTYDFSINLIAPSEAGSYRGYWMFKNASGTLFGVGTQGNKPWWVDIKVAGPSVTTYEATMADNGKTFLMNVGDKLKINLDLSYGWSETSISNPAVIAGAQDGYFAFASGSATLSITGNPECLNTTPPCGMPSIIYTITVIVQ